MLSDRGEYHWILGNLQFIWGMSTPKSIGVRKCRGHLLITLGLVYLHSFLPLGRVYLNPTSFIGRILPNSHLSLVSCDLGSIMGITIITWCDALNYSTTRTENTCPTGSDEKYPIPIPSPGVIQTQGVQIGTQTPWCVSSLKSSEVLYKGSYGLPVFLHNTSLHVA